MRLTRIPVPSAHIYLLNNERAQRTERHGLLRGRGKGSGDRGHRVFTHPPSFLSLKHECCSERSSAQFHFALGQWQVSMVETWCSIRPKAPCAATLLFQRRERSDDNSGVTKATDRYPCVSPALLVLLPGMRKRWKTIGIESNGKEQLDRIKWLHKLEIPIQATDRKTDQILDTIA